MPLNLPDNQQDTYFVAATDDLGLKTTSLGAGQTITVTSGDPATVVLTPDATANPAPDGTPCIASGVVAPAASPAAPNTPITLTAAVLNADGTPGTDDKGALIAPATDTVTIIPGLAHATGFLFGIAANSVPIAVGTKR